MRSKIFTLFASLFFAFSMLGVSANASAGCVYVATTNGYFNQVCNGAVISNGGYYLNNNGARVYGVYRGGGYNGNVYNGGYRGGNHGGYRGGYHGGYRGGNHGGYRGGYHGGRR